jgi:branched-chain amino acid transport system ATP-binding protein
MNLTVSSLHAYYGKSHILHGVDMTVQSGEIVALVGRNGVGRSTLMKTIMGYVTGGGSIRLSGQELLGLPTHTIARMGIGYVPETRDIFPSLTVRENLILGQKRNAIEGRWTIDSVLERFSNLKTRIDTEAGRLSGGEQQMLSISRALMGDPSIVIIDEPTEGLAPKLVDQVATLLLDIRNSGTSVVLVEQKLDIALEVASRVYVMGHGRMVFEGAPSDLQGSDDIIQEWLRV